MSLVNGGNVQPKKPQLVQPANLHANPPDVLDRVFDILEVVFGVMKVLVVLALIGGVVWGAIWFISTTTVAVNSSNQRINLTNEMETSVSNVRHAIANERSVAYVKENSKAYLAPIVDAGTQVSIEPASCQAKRSDTTYSVVGIIPSQKYYMVFNSVTGKTLQGNYVTAATIPDLTC